MPFAEKIREFFKYVPMREIPAWLDAGEETANYLTHLPGALGSVVALIVLIIRGIQMKDVYRIVSYIIFGLSLNILYWASTLYHFVQSEEWKRKLRYCDHVSIYILIAGSYTPFTMITLREHGGWIIFSVIWIIALLGTAIKILKFDGFFKLSLFFFIAMGWAIVFAMKDLISLMTTRSLYWLVIGGLSYTIGTFFFSKDEKIPYYHAIWHLYVLGGSVAHFVCVYSYI